MKNSYFLLLAIVFLSAYSSTLFATQNCVFDKLKLISQSGHARCINIHSDYIHIQFHGSDFTAASNPNHGEKQVRIRLNLHNNFKSNFECVLNYQFFDFDGKIYSDSAEFHLHKHSKLELENFYPRSFDASKRIDYVRGVELQNESYCREKSS